MATDDGGPAFPIPHPEMTVEGQRVDATQGMSLRDWFAGQTLSSPYTCESNDPAHVADWAYAVADAMLQARRALERVEEGGE